MIPMIPVLIGVGAFMIGLFIGLAIWYRTKSRDQAEETELKVQIATLEEEARAAEAERLRWAETMEQRMREDFQVLAGDALNSNTEVLTMLVKRDIQPFLEPFCDRLRALEQTVRTAETTCAQAQQEMQELVSKVRQIQSSAQRVATPTAPTMDSTTAYLPSGERRGEVNTNGSDSEPTTMDASDENPAMDSKKSTRLRNILWTHLRHYKFRLIAAGILTLGVTVAALLRPLPLKLIIDLVVPSSGEKPRGPIMYLLGDLHGGDPMTFLYVAAGSILGIALFAGLCSYLQIFMTSIIGFKMVNSLRRELFAHLQRLSLSFHNRARSGDLVTKVSGDTKALRTFFTDDLLKFGSQILTILAMLAVMVIVDWPVGLVAVATCPILCLAMVQMYRKTTKLARRQRRKEGHVTARLNEVFSSMPLVQAYGREKYESARLDQDASQNLQDNVRMARLEAAASRSTEILTAVGLAGTILFAGVRVIQGHLSPGDLVLFSYYLRQMYKPIRGMARFFINYSKAMTSADRISEVLEIEPEIQDQPEAIEAPEFKGKIAFDNVSFDYGDGKAVLREVSFTVSPGQRLALVGLSGAGKSTIASLLLRLYQPQEGGVSIDDINIRHFRRESLRRQISIVLQQALLFGASIKENIAYGKPDATDEEIEAAAKAANADEFIRELENGYDTEIGERGAMLSGGQRQRIAIARALIRNPRILILDEPMTGLDVESEAKVRQALDRLMAEKTCIMITHDLQSVAGADQVLLLEAGIIVERGKHDELLAKSGRYRQLNELDAQQPAVHLAS